MASRLPVRKKKEKLIAEVIAILSGQPPIQVGTVVREAGGAAPLPEGRPGRGFLYEQSCDGSVKIVRE